MRRSPVPPSPAFEAIARDVRFRDRIAIVVKAPPEAIFQALYDVTLRDIKLAWLLGELRYLPSRMAGRLPAADARRSFMETLLESGTLVLRDDTPRELITGSAAQLHRVHQAPQRFASREAFKAFDDPGYEKLFMSVRVVPAGRTGEHWMVLEHATQALSPLAERKFARYWRVIKPTGAFVTWLLLRAVRRRAEHAAVRPRPLACRPDRLPTADDETDPHASRHPGDNRQWPDVDALGRADCAGPSRAASTRHVGVDSKYETDREHEGHRLSVQQ